MSLALRTPALAAQGWLRHVSALLIPPQLALFLFPTRFPVPHYIPLSSPSSSTATSHRRTIS